MWTRGICFALLAVFSLPSWCVSPSGGDALSRLKGFVRNVSSFNRMFPQEKAYLHLDNTSYFLDETIWFKAYVVRTDSSALTDLSRILYVELVSPEGDVVVQRKMELVDGQAHGELPLTGTLASGYYEVRAYTRYMRNWDAACCYSRVVPVYRKPKEAGDYSFPFLRAYSPSHRIAGEKASLKEFYYLEDVSKALYLSNTKKARETAREFLSRPAAYPDSSVTGVAFYPEGGHLVSGVPCRVAFEVSCGRRTSALTGWLADGSGNRLGTVSTLREGRGVFSCVPSSDGPLYLCFQDEKDKVSRYPLPSVDSSGVSMQLDVLCDSALKVSFRGTADCQDGLYGLCVQRAGNVCYFDTLRLPADLELPRSWFKGGVHQLTLFDPSGRIWADRLFFNAPMAGIDYAPLAVSTSTFSPTAYGKVRMQLRGLPGNTYSLSVQDDSTRFGRSPHDALSWMLLGSELKGFVRDAGYYFESDDSVHRAAADLLMLVQGWRRYDWAVMSGVRPFVKSEPLEDGLFLDGRVFGKRKGDRVDGVRLSATLYNSSGVSFRGHCLTDSGGYYAFQLPDSAMGSWRMVLHTRRNGEPRDYRVRINRWFAPPARDLDLFETCSLPPDSNLCFRPGRLSALFPKAEADTLADVTLKRKKNKKDISLGMVTKKGRRYNPEKTRQAWDNPEWFEKREFIYYNSEALAREYEDRGEEVPFLIDWIKSKPYLLNSLSKKKETGYVRVRTQRTVGKSDIPYNKYDLVTNLPPVYDDDEYNFSCLAYLLDELDRIYVVLPYSTYRIPFPHYSGGFVLETTDIERLVMQGAGISGLSNSKEEREREGKVYDVRLFQKYTFDVKQKGSRGTTFEGYNIPRAFYSPDYSKVDVEPDFRRTLYWNPDVKTDRRGEAYVEFWNNAACKAFSVSIEGIQRDGSPAVFPSPQSASF